MSETASNKDWLSMSGDYGDIIAMLPSIRSLGGARLRLFPSEHTTWPMTRERADNLRPLLETCPYLLEVEWGEVPRGRNLDEWRNNYNGNFNLADMMAEWLGLPHPPREEPWLKVTPRREARHVFGRTPRWRQGSTLDWREVVRLYGKEAAFVGKPSEHQAFCSEFGEVPLLETPTMLEVAEVLAGSELVVCNQSGVRWVGESLKCNILVEEGDPRNTYFKRAGARYNQV